MRRTTWSTVFLQRSSVSELAQGTIYIHYIGIYWLCLFIRVVKMVKHIFFLYDGHLEGVPH